MRSLSSNELLNVWVQGANLSLSECALLLLTATCAQFTPEQLAQLTIGHREALLFAFRDQTFGPQLAGLATCPACAMRLEFSVQVAEIRSTPPEDLDRIPEVTQADYKVRFRLPNSLDLANLNSTTDEATNRHNLLESCV